MAKKKKKATPRTEKSVLAISNERRDELVRRGAGRPEPLPDATREAVIALLREGATLAEICAIRGIASYGEVFATRSADPEFDAAVRAAIVQGAEAAIAESAEVTKAANASGDLDQMRIAEAFSRCATSYAEKVAPREFGQLVKLGNVDGGALTLSVVSYAAPGTAAQKLEAKLAVPAIEAKFEELDPV